MSRVSQWQVARPTRHHVGAGLFKLHHSNFKLPNASFDENESEQDDGNEDQCERGQFTRTRPDQCVASAKVSVKELVAISITIPIKRSP